MLDAIEELHDRGYIHRDIKPSNFVVGKGKLRDKVIMVDFGLCKVHLDAYGSTFVVLKRSFVKSNNNHNSTIGHAVSQRPNADFRGTITYASLNAHTKIVPILFALVAPQQTKM